MLLPSFTAFRPSIHLSALILLVGGLLGPSWTLASEAAATVARYNSCVCYEVDPNWPQRPADVAWGQMPGVAVDAHDNVWLFTRAEPPVQVYDASGKFVRAWGKGLVQGSHFLRFDPQGNVWITDVRAHTVRCFTPEGNLLKTFGVSGEAGDDASHFNKPTDMAFTPEGDVFISDGYVNTRIVHIDKQGKFVKSWGSAGRGPGQFNLPHSIAIDSKRRIYVADRNNARVQVFDESGKFLSQWTNVIVPWGLWITPDDQIWVSGSSPVAWRAEDALLSCPPKDQIAIRFDPSGNVRQIWTFPLGQTDKEKPGELNWFHGIALDSHGNLYAGDIMGRRAQKFLRIEPTPEKP